MTQLDRAIRAGVQKAMEAAARPGGAIDKAMRQILGVDLPDGVPLDERQFTFAMVLHMESAGASRKDALDLAHPTLLEYLAEIGKPFGDPEYAWDRSAAHDVANKAQEMAEAAHAYAQRLNYPELEAA